MNETRKDFLVKLVGFSMNDLSMSRRLEFKAIATKHPYEWNMIALSKKSVDEWEKWGFGLFNNYEFIAEVNSTLEAFSKITDEELKKDSQRGRDPKGKPKATYNYADLEKKWEVFKSKDGNWQYNPLAKKEVISDLEVLRCSDRKLEDLTEKEKWQIMLAVNRSR